MKRFVALLGPLIAVACATAGPEVSQPGSLGGVQIRFEKRGASLDSGSQRLAESGTAAVTPGEDHWLRLENGSPYTIEIPTQSMYVGNPPEWVKVGPTTSGFAVRDGAVLVVLFQSFEGRYGFADTSSSAYLPSGRSVLFQVPKRYLGKKRSIFVEFSAYTESVLRGEGKPVAYRVSYNSSNLPQSHAPR